MFRALTYGARADGLTKERALMGLCHFYVSDDLFEVPETDLRVTIATVDDEKIFDREQPLPREEVDQWAEDVEKLKLEPDTIRQLASLQTQIEQELAVAEGTDDWRIDYGDDEITYVTKSESGTVVSIDEHWDQAKESREQANNWSDGETYWTDEVEGEVDLALTDIETEQTI
jgi:hypothetical protein